jgi:hypothetical protein
MVMVGNANEHGVDLLMDLVEHLAIVEELRDRLELDLRPGFRKLLLRLAELPRVHVGKGHDAFAQPGDLVDADPPLVGTANDRHVDLGVRRGVGQQGGHAQPLDDGRCPQRARGLLEELPAR